MFPTLHFGYFSEMKFYGTCRSSEFDRKDNLYSQRLEIFNPFFFLFFFKLILDSRGSWWGLVSNAAPRDRDQSSRQIGPPSDQYGIFRDVSRVLSAHWLKHTPQSHYLLSSRESAIFVRHHLSPSDRGTAIVIDTAAIYYDCIESEQIARTTVALRSVSLLSPLFSIAHHIREISLYAPGVYRATQRNPHVPTSLIIHSSRNLRSNFAQREYR